MVLGAIILFEKEKRLSKLGADQGQARIIGQCGAIVLGGSSQVAARLEDEAFDEKLPAGANSPVSG